MRSKAATPTVNSGSMADIAFLLLIFFLVTTTITQEKGLSLRLPPKPTETTSAPVHDRNVFKVLINSRNQYLIEGELAGDLQQLRTQLKAFILNDGADPNLSDSPQEAIVSIKANRGTDYKYFISALDEAKGAYYDIYGDRVNLSGAAYRQLDLTDPAQKLVYERGKAGIPMNISIAEPEILPQ